MAEDIEVGVDLAWSVQTAEGEDGLWRGGDDQVTPGVVGERQLGDSALSLALGGFARVEHDSRVQSLGGETRPHT